MKPVSARDEAVWRVRSGSVGHGEEEAVCGFGGLVGNDSDGLVHSPQG